MFIFLSIAWLLQFTRLISVSNLLQIDSLSIFILSIYLIPNLFTIILPFIVIIGISITSVLFDDKLIVPIEKVKIKTQDDIELELGAIKVAKNGSKIGKNDPK